MEAKSTKVPLVYTVVEDSKDHPDAVNVSYVVSDIVIMTAEIQRDIVCDPDGSPNLMTLTQLMVTPHEHLVCLDEVLTLAASGSLSGERWDALLARISALLSPPTA